MRHLTFKLLRNMETPNPLMQCQFCTTRDQCFFSSLTNEESEFLMQNKREITFKAGETIYKQGTESKYLIFLTSGMAKVMVEGDNGKNFILQLVKSFEFVDFPAIFEDDMLYRTSIAIVESKACLIDVAAFKKIVMSNKSNIPKRFISKEVQYSSFNIQKDTRINLFILFWFNCRYPCYFN